MSITKVNSSSSAQQYQCIITINDKHYQLNLLLPNMNLLSHGFLFDYTNVYVNDAV